MSDDKIETNRFRKLFNLVAGLGFPTTLKSDYVQVLVPRSAAGEHEALIVRTLEDAENVRRFARLKKQELRSRLEVCP